MLISAHRVPARRLGALLAPLAVILAACSSGSTPSPAATVAASAAAPSAAASQPVVAGVTLNVAEDAKLGKFLTGTDGKTLYIFTNDTQADTSTCADKCATSWPPLLAAAGVAPAAPTGVTGKIATFTRADGGVQVSYNGKPLYYYAKDTKAGDVTGQGVGGKWFVAAP